MYSPQKTTNANVIFEGPLTKLKYKADREKYFQLTKTQLMYSKLPKNVMMKGPMMTKSKIMDLADIVVSNLAPRSMAHPHVFQISTAKESFVVSASTLELKNEWIHLLSRAISRVRMENGKVGGGLLGLNVESSSFSTMDPQSSTMSLKHMSGHDLLAHSIRSSQGLQPQKSTGTRAVPGSAPVWTRDRDALFCSNCRSIFNLFHRRHHCRNCGLVFCGSCSRKYMLPNISTHSSRVREVLSAFGQI